MSKFKKIISTLSIILTTLLVIMIYSHSIWAVSQTVGHIEEATIEVYDQKDNYIFSTAMGIVKGDKYISQDNIEYIIVKVNEKKAVAKKIGKIDLLEGIKKQTNLSIPLTKPLSIADDKKKLISIYHTHNGESYAPGPESVPKKGEIHDIGKNLAAHLEKKGVEVVQSNNLHLPHDGAAYERSRSTALQLAKEQPDAIFDIHRDGIPSKEEYLEEVNGKTISQVRLVVGRQNPNRKSNDQFAKSLKAVSDKHYPGFIRDIFYGGGSYNQQVSTHALLLEMGTHVIDEKQVSASADILGDVIYQLLYGTDQAVSEKSAQKENTTSFRTALWIIVITAIGLISYLYVSEGSFSQVTNRVKNYFGHEIIDNPDDEGDR